MQEAILDVLKRIGAIITESHIVYTSGYHGSAYVNKDAVYPHSSTISQICREMAYRFRHEGVEAVLGPAIGGVVLSQWTAHHLELLNGRAVISAFAEKVGDDFVIKRGYDKLIAGRRVLVVEDVVTTGGSLQKVIKAARDKGSMVIGAAVMCNRGGITSGDLNISRLDALVNIHLESWPENECHLCAKGVPINTEVGKGREFLARKQ